MRCFIAFKPDKNLRKRLSEIPNLFNSISKFKAVEQENIHLTFFFWKDLTTQNIIKVEHVLKSLKFKRFKIELTDLNIFNKNKKPAVINISVNSEKIFKLKQELEYNFKEKNVIFDKRKFYPHLTLLRIKYIENMLKFNEEVKSIQKKFEKTNIVFDNLIFYQSFLTTKGPIYKELYKHNLT